ncbi:MAG: long-chain fatty acid--CoA ligase [Deltaproteobacteria bacterium]|nr:long-chain fatty acid--CoA ligase [Deltaproteobacteria bacterium]
MADNPYFVDESKPWFTKEAGWPDEVPKNIEFPEMTLGEMLRKTARQYPDYKAIWFLNTFMTFRKLDKYVDAFATALHKRGIKKGDVVTLLLPNSFQYVIAYYACMRIGAIASGVNPTYKPFEILHQLDTVGSKALIVLDALYEKQVAPIIEKHPMDFVVATNITDLADISGLKKILGKLLGKIPTGPVPDDALRFLDMLRTPIDLPEVEINPKEDPATYIMTGGTTGVPKAAVLTHFNCVSNTIQSRAWLFKVKPGACAVGVLPLFHSFAMTTVMNLTVNFGGLAMLFPRPPDTKELVDTIVGIGPDDATMYVGAEILFQRMADFLDNPQNKQYVDKLAGKLALCVSGAGPLHRPVQEKFERVTGGRLVEGYGLTETTPVVSAGPFWGERKIGTIGLPFPGTEWRIVDKDDYKKVTPTGESGEIAVAGPQVMKGYLNKPEETAETVVEMDGKRWCLTGDIGFMDELGRITINDRKKQLIKYKGYSVFPKEVEELVGGHESVSEVAVAGLPDEETGEVIKAWVVLNPEYKGKITESELLQWCKDNLTHYKVPRHIEFRDELPKTLVGKVLRRVLQEEDPIWKKANQGKKE